VVDVEAPDLGAPGGLVDQPGKDVDQRRFARAVGAEQSEDATLRYIERNIVERQLGRLPLCPA